MVVFGLGKNLLFKSILGRCVGVVAGAHSSTGVYRCRFAQVSGVYSYASGNIFVFIV